MSLKDYKLRPMNENDLKKVLEWRNSDRIRENMYTDHIISWDEHVKWYTKVKKDPNSIYLICEYKNKSIGLICLTDIDRNNGKCCWGFYLGDTDVPSGSGQVMEFLALEYIFENINIRKLYCEVFLFNKKVVNLHQKFGFSIEGKFTQHVLKNGEYKDVYVLAMYNDDWQKNKTSIKQMIIEKLSNK